MHRLLQGDVGSGKTVVAVGMMLAAVQGGHQGALMAPTEVLADQHYLGVRALADGLEVIDPGRLGGNRPVSVGLLTNKVPAKERARVVSELASGQMDIVIGTHALLTEDVRFASLGAVVVDEQHRFGVEQRAGLRAKGRIEESGDGATVDPDLLVMTATPIPRTAAMVVFGDLDMTVVDEQPPGRAPITTVWARGDLEEAAAWARIRSEVAAGHRAYVVCPLVEESERVVARSAVEEHARLSAEVLAGLRVGLLHGQLPTAQKKEVMDAFRDGTLQVLVATTVIEVGIDVPEATVVVVEDADRFGIAQLHQLRGRVGRSSLPSWCYLLGGGGTEDGDARLGAVERTTDGFELAEVDLELRGEGTVLGERQTGSSGLRLTKLRRDKEWVERAREVAESIVAADPDLDDHPTLLEEVRSLLDQANADFLFKS
jgi:ATP-dependent DNA helicase RecG